MPKSTSYASSEDRAQSPSHGSSASGGDDEYTPSSRTDINQTIRTSSIKRKRGRVNPTQLAYLERAYTADRSLDAARRKEISQKLGMDERQTQIWFQNRRAKAKLMAHRAQEGGGESNEPPPFPLPGSATLQDIQFSLQEESQIIMIPCTDVLIGKWRRMNTGGNDLLVYLSESRRTLTYYVRSADIGFKMRIPFDSIVATEYTNEIVPGCDRASLLLSKPPTFYREVASRTGSTSTTSGRSWRPANDWTEGGQASSCTRHEIIGPSGQLTAALRPLLSIQQQAPPPSNNLSIAPSASSSSLASNFFLPSPSLSYSSSSAGTSNSSTNSPPRHASPGPYFQNIGLDMDMGSRPSTSSGVVRGDEYTFEMHGHGRHRSRSQPPMQFPFNANNNGEGSFPQPTVSMPPHSASLGSSGFALDFDPFAHSMGASVLGVGIGEQPQQLQQQQQQDFDFGGFLQSDVALLPEHMAAARPTSSGGGYKLGVETAVVQAQQSPGTPQGPPKPHRRGSTFDGLSPLTQLNSPTAGTGASGCSSPQGHASSPHSAGLLARGGPRFMDIYSSQNLNLASYVLGNNVPTSDVVDSLSGGSPTTNPLATPTPAPGQPQQMFPGMMLPFTTAFDLAPAPAPRGQQLKDGDRHSPAIYDHAERVAFPA